jgi:hypothetical protein
LAPVGGYPGDETKAVEMFKQARADQGGRRHPCRLSHPQGPARVQRKDRRGRLLHGGSLHEPHGHPRAGAERRGAVLRPTAYKPGRKPRRSRPRCWSSSRRTTGS